MGLFLICILKYQLCILKSTFVRTAAFIPSHVMCGLFQFREHVYLQMLSLHEYGHVFVGFFFLVLFPLCPVSFTQIQEIQRDFALYFIKCDLSVSSAF